MADPTAGTGPGAPRRYRQSAPEQVPDLAVVEEQAEFDAISVRSQEDTAAAAERWRTGLAGLTTIVTAGLLLKGPADAAALDTGWRIALTVLFGTGIAVSIAGFWWALRASAGVPTTLRFDELRRDYGTVRLYRLDSARRAADELRRARAGGFLAALLLAAAVLTWWWAPTSANRAVTVTHAGGQSCGVVVDSDAGGLRLAPEKEATRVTIPWNTITAVKPATTCSGAESPALAAVTRTVLAEVLCLTLCPRCAASGRPPQVMLSTAKRLVAQHAAHLSAGGERRVVRTRTGGGAP